MRKKIIVLTAIFGLIAMSGVAAATDHTSEDTGDTTFNFGYDEDNRVFIWGSSASDGEFDCTLENGEIEASYVVDDGDGGLLVEDLAHLEGENEEEPVEFEPTDDSEATDSIPYTEDGHDCELTAGEVAGPEGQVNHGMFLKLFNAMFDGQARGCMVRHIARSDLGKGNQQVNVPDVDETEETGDIEDLTGSVEFETAMTDCVNGEDGEDGEDGEAEGRSRGAEMRPQWVTDMLAEKHGNGNGDGDEDDDDEDEDEEDESEEFGSENESSDRRGPPDHARGKGRNG